MAPRDGTWEVDLIWKYFEDTGTAVSSTESWYKKMDPAGSLDDRKHVYKLLLDEPAHTNPSGADLPTSMIPWNQQNDGIIKTFDTNLACGSLVKLTFRKYMGWGRGEPLQRSVSQRGWDAVAWLIKSLKANMPVRAHLMAKNHYVGIVGFRRLQAAGVLHEFLVIDPWAGGAKTGSTTISYAGSTTAFLGIARQAGTKIMYDGYEITALEGYYPF